MKDRLSCACVATASLLSACAHPSSRGTYAPAPAMTQTAASCTQDDDWMRVVRSQLLIAGAALVSEGYELADVYCASARQSDPEWFSVSLSPQDEYVFLGVCDQDCTSMRLSVYQGGTVRRNASGGDVPMLSYGPGQAGTHELRVTIARCDNEPCRYGVGLFRR